MVQIHLFRKDYCGMKNNILRPRGRKSLASELMNFGVHYVYTEGTKTEPNYIEGLKRRIAKKYNCGVNDINIICANGKSSKDTIRLFEFAYNDVAKELKKDKKIDHVWIFFDKDDYKEDDFKSAIDKINIMNNSKDTNADGFNYNLENGIAYHACWSNEAFELWLCLHYEYIQSGIGRKDYNNKLKDKLRKEYKKNNSDIFEDILSTGGDIESAIKYAKKLVKENGIANPSTSVFEFVEYFIKYMDIYKINLE